MALLSAASFSVSSVFLPLAIVLVFTGVLLAVLSFVRRKMKVEESTPRDFSLTDLRDLHRQGKMTDDEFEKAKSLIVNKVHTKLAKEAKPSMASKPMEAELKSEDAN